MKPGDMHQQDDERYPYRHHGPSVYGSKLADYLVSEQSMEEDDLIDWTPRHEYRAPEGAAAGYALIWGAIMSAIVWGALIWALL